MCLVFGRWLAKFVVSVSFVAVFAQNAIAAPLLLGMLFNEVSDIRVSRRADGAIFAVVQGRAWGWYHHVTFPVGDIAGKQCLQKFMDYMSHTDNKQIQFGGYASGQIVDTPNRTTKSDITVLTECYYR